LRLASPHSKLRYLDPTKLGLCVTVFIEIQLGDHSPNSLARFKAELAAVDEVMDFYRLASSPPKLPSPSIRERTRPPLPPDRSLAY
jgi:DNA-binding Lrp family transcriptional regulator